MFVSSLSMNHSGIRIRRNNFLTMRSRFLLCDPTCVSPLYCRSYFRSQNFQCRTALILDGEFSLPSRNSAPVSCIARTRAGQSSKSVAKIFSTMIRVSSGTRWFNMTGEYPPSSARRAQYKLGESQDSARKRLEYPENGGKGAQF